MTTATGHFDINDRMIHEGDIVRVDGAGAGKVFGTYHFVSKAYLQRYIDEAVYRFNTKELKESARFGYMFKKAIGTCYYKDVKMVA